jgi:hypothetical protein
MGASGASVKRALRWLAVATTLLGAVALLVLAFRMAGGVEGLFRGFRFFAWALLPFALALFGLRRSAVTAARSVGLTAASGFGLAVYSDMLFFTEHHSSTEGLVFLFIPLWQLMGCGVLLLVTMRRTKDGGIA